MLRDVDLKDISDGKLYDIGDMAKLGVDDCSGCHACCCGMGDSITLDPYDVFRLEKGLGKTFEELLSENLELRVADGIILPCLKMMSGKSQNQTGRNEERSISDKESCTFLNDAGRCSIHPFRPGICRLFPLGRIFENNTHRYFLQVNECHKERQTKIKIKKWIDTPELGRYEAYIDKWHYFIKNISDKAEDMPEVELKAVNMQILQNFFIAPYDINSDFYEQFYGRLEAVACR
ncbi:YkgJ family cysteine cluster protein [Butyrivibrio sp. AE3004]|uniref:YkgJ family cysteine cluster protein n=1 Tax=Butyrivibrio sp. AE3004 TaxID=1506994 RepID=UPI0004948BAD|nr:YkgJ family cysteine cluster protein [Butyrivibrio sp. AE3004]